MSSPDSPRSRRRIVIWVGLAVVAAAGRRRGRLRPALRRRRVQPGRRVPRRADRDPRPRARARRARDDFTWPIYGYTPTRRHYLPASKSLRPPFKRRWSWDANSLLEFTPVIAEGKLFVHQEQRRRLRAQQAHRQGPLAARPRPARRLRARLRGRPHLRDDPRARRLEERAGRRAAGQGRRARCGRKPLPSRTESSPLFADGRIYFGSEDGTVYALRAARRRRRLALQGDRGGQGRPRAGRRASSSSATTAGACTRSARATASGSGRVDDARRALRHQLGPVLRHPRRSPTAASTSATPTPTSTRSRRPRGKLAWRTGTGGYVYASAAVAQVAGRQADGLRRLLRRALLRARRARAARCAGRTRRRAASPAPRRSSATSSTSATCKSRTTTGLGARTGRKVFRSAAAASTRSSADGRNLYVVGYASLSQLRPKAPAR